MAAKAVVGRYVPELTGAGPKELCCLCGVLLRRKRKISTFTCEGAETFEVGYKVNPNVGLAPGQTEGILNRRLYAGRTIIGSQETDSDSHHWPPPKQGKLADVGGEFLTTKKWAYGQSPLTHISNRLTLSGNYGQERHFIGYLWPDGRLGAPGGIGWPSGVNTPVSELNQLGATAIARCKPGKSAASAATALLETMREGLPSIPFSAWESLVNSARKGGAARLTRDELRAAARKSGGEHLNTQFGWLPLVDDVGKVVNAMMRFQEIWDQYYRDVGRVVRRRYVFPTETSTQTTVIGNSDLIAAAPLNTWMGADTRRLVRVRETLRSVWFSGAFTYFIPGELTASLERSGLATKIDQILGLRITPDTLWALTPWSWAADWFSNAGDVISNLSSYTDGGLCMRYGYLMEHTIVTDTYTRETQRPFKAPNLGIPADCSLSLVTESKRRIRANPFGFGVSWSGLSPFQISIAAALGLSRS